MTFAWKIVRLHYSDFQPISVDRPFVCQLLMRPTSQDQAANRSSPARVSRLSTGPDWPYTSAIKPPMHSRARAPANRATAQQISRRFPLVPSSRTAMPDFNLGLVDQPEPECAASTGRLPRRPASEIVERSGGPSAPNQADPGVWALTPLRSAVPARHAEPSCFSADAVPWSAATEMFVELNGFRSLLKAKKEVNVAGFATR
jgi:hypothetical protein